MQTNKTSYSTIIRFQQSAEQADGPIRRVLGFVEARHLLDLFDDATLDANPRSAKTNTVTRDIIDSVREQPELFQFKTKGVLLGTSDYRELERRRYELHFQDPAYEGLLDGGHNMLALGLYLLSQVMDQRAWRRLKMWDDMKGAWVEHREAVRERRDEYRFKVPVELLVPSDLEDDSVVSAFKLALVDICAARNNNASLTLEARSNQRGFYEEIRKRTDPALEPRVEWKTNEWESEDKRPVKVRDLVALAWIPLSVLRDEGLLPSETEAGTKLRLTFPAQHVYSVKIELSRLFDQLMEHPDVTKQYSDARRELHNTAVGSAFDVLRDLPRLYDRIYREMGEAYNRAGGKFGRIRAVRVPKRGSASTPFYAREAPYGVPEGFVVPVVYGLKALMTVHDGKVGWVTDPDRFLDQHLDALVSALRMPMDMAGLDPQKVAKTENTYRYMVGEVEKALITANAQAA